MEIKGLSKADVEKRVKNGEVNIVPSKKQKHHPQNYPQKHPHGIQSRQSYTCYHDYSCR